MKKSNLAILVISTIVIAVACHSNKKVTSSTVTTTNITTTNASVAAKPTNGIYAPGTEELTAIQAQHPNVTLDKLREGYAIYAQGPCIQCHEAKNIYKRDVMQWKFIMDDMALKAKLTDAQKDAVYKYVLAIKATQTK